jgi:hypothetical protein
MRLRTLLNLIGVLTLLAIGYVAGIVSVWGVASSC